MTAESIVPHPTATAGDTVEHPIIFFDGLCNLCNAWVDFMLRHDPDRIFRYASLQGETARKLVPEYANDRGLSTVVLLDEKGHHVRSTAILRIAQRLREPISTFAGVSLLVPKPARDFTYRLISRSRYRIFGKKDSCRLPTEEERELFLP